MQRPRPVGRFSSQFVLHWLEFIHLSEDTKAQQSYSQRKPNYIPTELAATVHTPESSYSEDEWPPVTGSAIPSIDASAPLPAARSRSPVEPLRLEAETQTTAATKQNTVPSEKPRRV